MLSTRGQAYAEAGLADGYLGQRKAIFNKDTRHGIVSFSNAENFLMQDVMLEYIRTKAVHYVDSQDLTYHEGPFGSTRLRTAMASLLNTYFHPARPISADHIVFANGVTSLNAICALILTNPGDGILLGQPIYGSFFGDLRTLSGCKLVYTPFHGDDQFSLAAVDRYEEALLRAQETGTAIKALLICNPHNPLGRYYPRQTLEALLKLCQKYSIHLISDEVYALSVYGGNDEETQSGFVSALSVDPIRLGVNPDLVHVLYGMSKDFAVAGLRLGCLISYNEDLLRSALSLSRFHWPSHISCSIATAILEDSDFICAFLQQSRQSLKSHHSFATRILDEAAIPYKRCTAGFFLWIDLSKCLDKMIVDDQGGWAAEQDLSRRLREIGVHMSSGYAYQNELPGWYRVIFTVNMETLKEGLCRITHLYGS